MRMADETLPRSPLLNAMATTDDRNENPRPPKNSLEDAQLRKLELEIDALRRAANEENSVGVSKQEKIKLEVKTLLWQTGRVYRLSQFAVIFSILATLVTVFATVYGIWSSYQKDTEARIKDRTDRTDSLYRTAIQRLIQYPVEPKITISDAVFTFRDLEQVVSFNYQDDAEKKKRQIEEAGFLIAQLMNSPEVDLSLTRNVEFDRKAMKESKYYREFLISNPKYNRDIISKYKNILSSVHDKAPCYSMVPDPKTKEVFLEYECKHGEPEPTFLQYVGLFYAYKSHVALFDHTAAIDTLSEEAAGYQTLAFCWFVGATDNVPLTIEIFGGDAERVSWKWQADCHMD
jgi:hypothetical protein